MTRAGRGDCIRQRFQRSYLGWWWWGGVECDGGVVVVVVVMVMAMVVVVMVVVVVLVVVVMVVGGVPFEISPGDSTADHRPLGHPPAVLAS